MYEWNLLKDEDINASLKKAISNNEFDTANQILVDGLRKKKLDKEIPLLNQGFIAEHLVYLTPIVRSLVTKEILKPASHIGDFDEQMDKQQSIPNFLLEKLNQENTTDDNKAAIGKCLANINLYIVYAHKFKCCIDIKIILIPEHIRKLTATDSITSSSRLIPRDDQENDACYSRCSIF